MNAQNRPTLQVFQSFSRKCRTLYFQFYPKEFIRFLFESIVNLLKAICLIHKKTSRGRISKPSSLVLSKENNLEAKKRHFGVQKSLQLSKVTFLPVISHLSWYGAVCSRPCCYIQQQECDYSVSCNASCFKVSSWPNPTYQIDWLKKKINKKFFAKADSIVDKILSCPRIKLTTLILDCLETRVLLLDVSHQLRRKKAEVHDIYFTLLDAAGLNLTLVLNQNVKTKERVKVWTSQVEIFIHTGCCCSWVCARFSVD